MNLMKIRWINTEVNPLPQAASWIKFVAKYPVIFVIPASVTATYSFLFWKWITAFESGEKTSIYLGHLKPAYEFFGKWGVVGFFIFLTACFAYLFWLYAISKPNK
jgi:hypothetical protein